MQEYYIHDNGGRPFIVVRDGTDVYIYLSLVNEAAMEQYRTNNQRDGTAYNKCHAKGTLLKKYTDIDNFFDGPDPEYGEHGNSILFELPLSSEEVDLKDPRHWYIFVGEEIYKFITNEPIKHFVSPLGNSDVPYPYATTFSRTYLLIENVYLNNQDPSLLGTPAGSGTWALDLNGYSRQTEPYSKYYGHTVLKDYKWLKPKGHHFDKTVLYARRGLWTDN